MRCLQPIALYTHRLAVIEMCVTDTNVCVLCYLCVFSLRCCFRFVAKRLSSN